MAKIIRIQHIGGAGNRIFQYFFGALLQSHVQDSQLFGLDIQSFGLHAPFSGVMPSSHLDIEGTHGLNVLRIAHAINSGLLDAVTCRVYAQRMEYLPLLERARELLGNALREGAGGVVPADCIVINIRWPQPSDAGHGSYMPLPIDFYKRVVEQEKLRPIFMGQIEDGRYFDELRKQFGEADFWESKGPLWDFNTIANATHIVTSISTFSWLAAWLSRKAKRIHLPLCGLFNPEQRPDIDLMPTNDERYVFYGFPITYWHATPQQVAGLFASDPSQKLARQDVMEKKRSLLKVTL